jgi:hypothetical protein
VDRRLIELAVRAPVSLSRAQALVIALVGLGVVLAFVLGAVLEGMLGGCVGYLMRLTGRRPPTKGPIAAALDELEARLERERRDRRPPPDGS